MPVLGRIMQRWTGTRPGELRRVWPLAVANASVMGSLYLLKPARNALFLDRFTVEQLPYVMLIVALFGAGAATAYGRVATAVRMDRLQAVMFGIFVLSLLGFRALFRLDSSVVYYLFYVWVALFGLVATSLVWQLANAKFNPREARRLFGVVGTGGISGAIGGGFFTSWTAGPLGTENLLFVAAGLLVLAWGCMRLSYDARSLRAPRAEQTKGALTEIRESRLLSSIAITGLLVAIVAVIVDVQFNDVAQRFVPDKDDKAAFFGRIFAYLNIFAILVQVLVTPRLLTRFGVGAGLLVLPVSLGLGSVALLALPGLLTGVLPKLADGSLRHSTHKSASEILYIPVPPAVTKRTKLFVDASVDSFATGIGALLVLLLVNQFGVSYRSLSLLSLGLVVLWTVIARDTHRAYVDAFRQALARRQIDFDQLRINVAEGDTVDALVRALDARGVRQIQYALDMLVTVSDDRLMQRVPELLGHPVAGVRERAVRVLGAQRSARPDLVRPLLTDTDHRVRVEAAHYLCTHGSVAPDEQLKEWLTGEDEGLRAAALGAVARYGNDAERRLVDDQVVESILTMTGGAAERVRADLASILALQDRPELEHYWVQLRDDTSDVVVRSAIESAGESQRPAHLSWLFELIDDKKHRMDARLALAAYGEGVLDEIAARLADVNVSDRVKRTLPRVLARIESQRSVDILLEHVSTSDTVLRRAILGALEKARDRFERVSFDDPRLAELLREEIRSYYFHRDIAQALEGEADTAEVKLLRRSLAQKQSEALGRVFRIMALNYPPKDIRTAYRALLGEDRDLRASALELLDNVLPHDLMAGILPMFEEGTQPGGLGARSVPPPRGSDDAYAALMGGSDPWLRALALYAMKASGSKMFEEWAERARSDDHSIVRETALAGLSDASVA